MTWVCMYSYSLYGIMFIYILSMYWYQWCIVWCREKNVLLFFLFNQSIYLYIYPSFTPPFFHEIINCVTDWWYKIFNFFFVQIGILFQHETQYDIGIILNEQIISSRSNLPSIKNIYIYIIWLRSLCHNTHWTLCRTILIFLLREEIVFGEELKFISAIPMVL